MFSMKKKCCHIRMLSPNKSCSKDNLDRVTEVQQYNPLIHQQLRESKIQAANSLRSKRFRACSSRKLGQKQKKNEWRGRGRGKKGMLARKPHNFEKLRSWFWLVRCGLSVDYLALETSIKQGIRFVYMRHRSSLIWFVVADYRWFGLVFTWIVFVGRFMRSESSKCKWRSSSGD